ncbi:dihydrofolate reductase family protein [Terrimonas alba]|uniref:dihydrofolate reductase family protein n=1 Tax=Terrimonas alba TaxID=3349636 RepID=UPI0035F28A36
MRKLILVVHTSLDGFVAGLKGEFDDFPGGEENLDFVCQLTEEADAALFGRNSYQLLNSYWPAAKDTPNASGGTVAYSTWYNKAHKIVVSKTLTDEGMPNTSVIRENIQDEINAIKSRDGKNILLFGSPVLTKTLMQLDLIDSYWIFVNPVIFGKGIPLFTEPTNKTKLTLTTTRQFFNGEIGLYYIVNRHDDVGPRPRYFNQSS